MELKLGDIQTTALIPLAVKANETLRPVPRIRDQTAVEIIKALNSGKVARYVSDFPTRRLIETKNVVLTPHLGGTTVEAEANCARMAAQEIDDYLRNGNIRNSVNLPDLSLERSGEARICLIHRNLPGVLADIMPIFAKDRINVENMTNKSRGNYAYSVFDVNSDVDETAIRELEEIEGMIRVRVLEH